MGERCTVERRLEAGRAHYRAVAGGRVVARSVGFDSDDTRAEAAALDQLDGVLRMLGWRPAGTDGPLYERE